MAFNEAVEIEVRHQMAVMLKLDSQRSAKRLMRMYCHEMFISLVWLAVCNCRYSLQGTSFLSAIPLTLLITGLHTGGQASKIHIRR